MDEAQLRRELLKVEMEISYAERKLQNDKFVSRAPKKVVANAREKLASLEQKHTDLTTQLEN